MDARIVSDLVRKPEDMSSHNELIFILFILAKLLKHSSHNYSSRFRLAKTDMEFSVLVAYVCLFAVGVFAYSAERESSILSQGKRHQQLQVSLHNHNSKHIFLNKSAYFMSFLFLFFLFFTVG